MNDFIYPYGYQNYCISTNEVNLIKRMNLVWEQHIMWTRMLLISIAENLKDFSATETRLLQNPRDIANVFERFYGKNIANVIEKLITEHLAIGEKLIFALKNKDQKAAADLNAKWYKNADEIAETFSNFNPFYKRSDVQAMMYEHLRLTSNEVEERLAGNYVADIKAFDEVQREVLGMVQYFVDGIVCQFPDLF